MSTPSSGPLFSPVRSAMEPRWEWRSFEHKHQLWQAALDGANLSTGVDLTSETYLVSAQTYDNVKLCGGRVEVERLIETNPVGCELWQPLLKESFPLVGGVLTTLCQLWHCDTPAVETALPTDEDLLSLVGARLPHVRIVPVRKWRRALTVGDCAGERATVLIGGYLLETLSLYHRDAATLERTLRERHLELERNTNYIRAIRRVVGWPETPIREPVL